MLFCCVRRGHGSEGRGGKTRILVTSDQVHELLLSGSDYSRYNSSWHTCIQSVYVPCGVRRWKNFPSCTCHDACVDSGERKHSLFPCGGYLALSRETTNGPDLVVDAPEECSCNDACGVWGVF